MLEKFKENIKKYNLQSFAGAVVALSGGSDSVCLLYLMTKLRQQIGIKLYAAHINHGIRENAGRDELFCKNLCEKWDIPFFSKKCDIPKMSKELKISSELCGRQVRYAFFDEVAKKAGNCAILTAHNKNDNAETVVLNLLRGSGSGGMGAIMPVRGNIIRPLLDFSKNEIEEYLKNNNINWVEDETNAENLYTRNIVRHEIIPALRRINPSAEDTILRCARLLKEDDDFLSSLADKSDALTQKNGTVAVNIKILATLPAPVAKRVIIKAVKAKNLELSETTVNAVLELSKKQSGKKFVFPCGGEALRQYDEIIFTKNKPNKNFFATVSAGEKIFIKEAGIYVGLSREKPSSPCLPISEKCTTLTLRPCLPGDRFTPSGMRGTKKVSDYFSDKKIPLSKRGLIPVFLFGEKIAAVGTLRADNEFVPASEKEALYLTIN